MTVAVAWSGILISILGLVFVFCLCSTLCCLRWWPWYCVGQIFRETRPCASVYSDLTIARGFKVKSLYFPLHTVIHTQLRGAARSYSYGIITGRWGRKMTYQGEFHRETSNRLIT